MRQTVIALAMFATSFGISAAMAGQSDLATTPQVVAPLGPSVDFVAVRASRLHLGITAAEVTAIMGQATKTSDYRNADTALQTLDFSAMPIRSKVTLNNGRVSHVALDVFGVGQDDLPAFTHVAWPGLNSATVLRLLGTPHEARNHEFFDIKVDQLIFRRDGELGVSLFLSQTASSPRDQGKTSRSISFASTCHRHLTQQGRMRSRDPFGSG